MVRDQGQGQVPDLVRRELRHACRTGSHPDLPSERLRVEARAPLGSEHELALLQPDVATQDLLRLVVDPVDRLHAVVAGLGVHHEVAPRLRRVGDREIVPAHPADLAGPAPQQELQAHHVGEMGSQLLDRLGQFGQRDRLSTLLPSDSQRTDGPDHRSVCLGHVAALRCPGDELLDEPDLPVDALRAELRLRRQLVPVRHEGGGSELVGSEVTGEAVQLPESDPDQAALRRRLPGLRVGPSLVHPLVVEEHDFGQRPRRLDDGAWPHLANRLTSLPPLDNLCVAGVGLGGPNFPR